MLLPHTDTDGDLCSWNWSRSNSPKKKVRTEYRLAASYFAASDCSSRRPTWTLWCNCCLSFQYCMYLQGYFFVLCRLLCLYCYLRYFEMDPWRCSTGSQLLCRQYGRQMYWIDQHSCFSFIITICSPSNGLQWKRWTILGKTVHMNKTTIIVKLFQFALKI